MIVDLIVLINAIVIVVDFYLNRDGELSPAATTAIEVGFTAVFVVEAAAKLFAVGPRAYW